MGSECGSKDGMGSFRSLLDVNLVLLQAQQGIDKIFTETVPGEHQSYFNLLDDPGALDAEISGLPFRKVFVSSQFRPL